MPIGDLTHATVEQVDGAIAEIEAVHIAALESLHQIHLKHKAKARALRSDALKKLNAYRDVLVSEQGGSE